MDSREVEPVKGAVILREKLSVVRSLRGVTADVEGFITLTMFGVHVESPDRSAMTVWPWDVVACVKMERLERGNAEPLDRQG